MADTPESIDSLSLKQSETIYGNTNVGGNATVQLGNTSHNVNVSGGLHFHGARTGLSSESCPDFIELIKSKLSFREECSRQIEIKEAHRKTFRWIFNPTNDGQTSSLRHWFEGADTLFWINGKAGSGKSTLMKYIQQHDDLQTRLKTWADGRELVIAKFFFWMAGQTLQKSYEGVLRSLLHQIIHARPELTPSLFPELSRYLQSQRSFKTQLDITITQHEAQAALKLLAKKMPKDLAVFLLIDGIDEFDGDHLGFSRLITEIAGCPSIKLLVSSRPTPACTQVFSEYPSLRLQDLTASDIRAYIEDELLRRQLLLDMDCLEPGLKDEIKTALLEKASGVFLWIHLVVKSLLKALGEYETREGLMRKIDELPSDLEKLYDYMFAQMSNEHRKEGSTLLQSTIRATELQKSPLTAIQLHYVSTSLHDRATCSTIEYDSKQENLRVKAVDGRLRSCCCGLIEVQYSEHNKLHGMPRVDFLHRTVYDYLREPCTWQRLKADSGISECQLEYRLLISTVYVLQRPTNLLAIDDHWVSVNIESSFVDCLEYSHSLSCSNDTRYVAFLAAAEELCRRYYGHGETLFPAFFNNVCKIFQDRRVTKLAAQADEPERYVQLGRWMSSMPSDARHNFTSYFVDKVRAYVVEAESRSAALLFTLVVRASIDEMLYHSDQRRLFSSNTEISSKEGRRDVMFIVPYLHACRLCSSDDIRQLHANFWITYPLSRVHYTRSTLGFLDYWKPSPAEYLEHINMAARFYTDLERCKLNWRWPDDPYFIFQIGSCAQGDVSQSRNSILKRNASEIEEFSYPLKRKRTES